MCQVEQVFISNRDKGFDSLKGIEHFQNLKELDLMLCYDKNISLAPLQACSQLEKISLELPLTKKQHQEQSRSASRRGGPATKFATMRARGGRWIL